MVRDVTNPGRLGCKISKTVGGFVMSRDCKPFNGNGVICYGFAWVLLMISICVYFWKKFHFVVTNSNVSSVKHLMMSVINFMSKKFSIQNKSKVEPLLHFDHIKKK